MRKLVGYVCAIAFILAGWQAHGACRAKPCLAGAFRRHSYGGPVF